MHKGRTESVNNSGGGDVLLHEALSADATLRYFLFYHYRFTLHATSSLAFFNGDVGTTLRGAFGSVLREIVCIDGHQECPACSIRVQCVFPTVFSPVQKPGTGPKRQQSPPRGFVIKPPLSSKNRYDPGEALVFDFILVGRLKDYLPYVIVPFTELGRRGIGLGRGKFTLAAIDAVKADGSTLPLYKDTDGLVRDVSVPIAIGDLSALFPLPTNREVSLSFLTPTHIRFNPTGEKGKSRPARNPEFFHIACRLRDRISALCREYGPAPLDMDFKDYGERSRQIRSVESQLAWVEDMRTSRSGQRHDLSGFVGNITFDGDLTEFWPFLVLGQYLHVGDNAVFGRGWYRIKMA
ncbi:MAG: CRISPR system precrRNA processing endoribonuclease RAMP protein Cas6 [Deltaproteobacteria bacterium]|nr:CRISPR system precrRNA processing endoribonuclease RAMP protein Cas6 [Deltaproteobacteria bacterium]